MAECFLNRIIKTGTTINNQDKTITENGQYAADASYTGLGTVTVDVSGSGAVVPKDINFYDMTDGAVLVASYNLSDLPLSALPDTPTHNGLTSQGWNYTLAQVNALTGKADIGAVYKTTSGDTEFDITLTAATGLDVTLALYKTGSGTMIIDWGDGATSTSDTTGQQNFAHTYGTVGDYTIKVQFTGAYYLRNSVNGNIFVTAADIPNYSLKMARLSEYVTSIGGYAFYYCYSLTSITIANSITKIDDWSIRVCISLGSITIPNSVTNFGTGVFYNNFALKLISLPKTITAMGYQLFNYCTSMTHIVVPFDFAPDFGNCTTLKEVYLPENIKSLANSMFYYCHSLKIVNIPSMVTNIASQAFFYCKSLIRLLMPPNLTTIDSSAFSSCNAIIEYDFSACTSVPTLAAASAFSGINALCKIKVPAALYDTWIAATNWSTYASYIVAV